MAEYRPGDSNQITREYLDSLMIELRQLDCVEPDTTFELFGEKFATPIMTAALSHLREPADGMVQLAKGAKAANAVMWCGYGSDQELEDIIATGARTIKIIKPFKDRKEIYRKLEHAQKAGAFAVGMDIDHGFNRYGECDMDGLMCGVSTEELTDFIAATDLPFIVKGVLSVTDANKCLDAGAAGIVISHHHGIMDYAVPPLAILRDIKDNVEDDMKIFVDCGINSGADAFKAMALGADAVSPGRALIEGFAARGAEAVTEHICRITRELAGFMAHTAAATLADIDPTVIWEG